MDGWAIAPPRIISERFHIRGRFRGNLRMGAADFFEWRFEFKEKRVAKTDALDLPKYFDNSANIHFTTLQHPSCYGSSSISIGQIYYKPQGETKNPNQKPKIFRAARQSLAARKILGKACISERINARTATRDKSPTHSIEVSSLEFHISSSDER
jgi:hypothetical protein